jgi:hypothetical protein
MLYITIMLQTVPALLLMKSGAGHFQLFRMPAWMLQEERSWCWEIMAMVLECNGNGITEESYGVTE